MSYGFNDDFKMKIHLRRRTPKRTVMKHSPDEVWDYLRNNGIAKIVQDGAEFKFYTTEKEIVSPKSLFSQLVGPLEQQKKENWGKFVGFKPFKVHFVTGEKIPVYGPYDKELHDNLNTKIDEIVDYFNNWNLLAEKVRLKFEKIPTDLQQKDNDDTLPRPKNNLSLTSKKAPRKEWTSAKGDFAREVLKQYEVDKVKPQAEKLYRDLKDACFKIFAQYKFQARWKWTPDKCYEYTLKINSA